MNHIYIHMIESIILVVAGLAGGSFGTLVGGSSLLTLPALMLLGLHPHLAIGTNRIGVAGQNAAGWLGFQQQKLIDYRLSFSMGMVALLGAIVGVRMVLVLSEQTLTLFIAGLNFLCLIFLILFPIEDCSINKCVSPM